MLNLGSLEIKCNREYKIIKLPGMDEAVVTR